MGGRGGGKKGGGGGGGGALSPSMEIKKLQRDLKYAGDQRRSVISHSKTVMWDKKVATIRKKIAKLQAKRVKGLAGLYPGGGK